VPDLFGALLRVHLTFALSSTVVFWATAFAPKGGPFHRKAGRWFARLIYATAWTGGTMAVADLLAPTWFHRAASTIDVQRLEAQTMWLVLYVLLIIVAPVQHGLAVVAAGADPSRVKSRTHGALNAASIAGTVLMLGASVAWQQWIFLIVVPFGFIVGLRAMSYATETAATENEVRREHLTSMITAGITLHTAFFVFGTTRSLGLRLDGVVQLVPWAVPALIGVPAILWYRRRYS
jgi:hypothetical protein